MLFIRENLYVDKAKELFGTTNNPNKAAYINIDGTLLDFSGGHYKRLFDHRDISDVYAELGDDLDNFPKSESAFGDLSDGMYAYMSLGNIRFSPESNGFDFNYKTQPTNSQYSTLYSILNKIPNDSCRIEFRDVYKDTQVAWKEYEPIRPRKIIEDIKYFYNNGSLPKESKLQAFRENKSLKEKLNNIKITNSPYTIKNILIHNPYDYRILYDSRIDMYMIYNAYDCIHRDLIKTAYQFGEYHSQEEFIDTLGDLQNYIEIGADGGYVNDTYIDPFLYYFTYAPKIDGIDRDEILEEYYCDGYDAVYEYDHGYILARNAPLEETELYNILGKPNKQYYI